MWGLIINFFLVHFVYSDTIVEIKTGKIKGIEDIDLKGNVFYSFLSIPYAKPPIGPLRFKEPQNADKWEGVRDHSDKIYKCFQREYMQLYGQEDCLYLNVHTPQINEHNLLPVMVFIHGGGYIQGSGTHDFFGAHYLMPEKIVLVTFNYRLGIFGFLNSNSSKLSLNNGIKDQVLALKWVQEHIKQFGGNASLVTIFGESAGASSVHLHVLSSMSKGLFQRAIMQSGSALNPWAYKTHDNLRAVAKFLKISSDNEEELLQNLQQIPTKEIFEAQEHLINILKDLVSSEIATSPVIEKENTLDTFLPGKPKALIESENYNDVPLMFGNNNKEGIFYGFLVNSVGLNFTAADTSALIPHTFNICSKSNKEAAIRKINKFYYNQTEPKFSDESLIPGFIDLFTDTFFMHGIQNSIQLHLEHSKSPIYFYKFSMDSKLNIFKNMFPSTAGYEGAAHLDDLPYLFKIQNIPFPEKGSIEYRNINIMTKLWANFAKYGNPTPHNDLVINDIWKPITKHKMNSFELGNKVFSSVNPDFERYQFWEDIYKNYSCDKLNFKHDDL